MSLPERTNTPDEFRQPLDSSGCDRVGNHWHWRHELGALALALSAGLAALGVMVGATFGMRSLQIRFTPNPHAPLPLMLLPPEPMLDAEQFVHGRALFTATCATCHGPAGRGMPGLGKDITKSLFVSDKRNAELVAFINAGREATDPLNTTRVPMPPKGGNPSLTDADLERIVTYLRGLQDPRRVPDVSNMPSPNVLAVARPTNEEKSDALAAAGGDPELAEYIAHGSKLFASSCASCHGRDGKGMPGLGKDMTSSTFIASLDEDGLLAFIKKGRDPNDPLNTTKVAMPPKGGNPALSEDDLLDIIAYIRSIHVSPPGAKP